MSISEFVYTALLKPAPLRKLANGTIRALLPSELERRGVKLAINPTDPVISGALLFGVYENGELDLFEKLLRPGMTVVDIGANIGLYTALAAKGVGPTGRVLALEPDPESFAFLRRTIAENGFENVEPFQVAASAAAGDAELYSNPDNRGDSRLYADPLLGDKPLQVRTTTVDELLGSRNLRSVDVLKIDTQGAEGLVLAGARETLANSPNLTILMEFWPYGLARTGSRADVLLALLRESGFQIFDGGAKFQRLETDADFTKLVARLQGRQYTNLLASRTLETAP